MAGTKGIAETVRAGIAPTVEAEGVSLWDVEYLREGPRRVLRITIDRAGGVTIEDCERVHRAIDPVLDALDPIDCAYDLEVSSPGVERVLRTEAHIDASVGVEVEAKLYQPENGQRSVRGVLLGREGESLLIEETPGAPPRVLPRAAVARLRTVCRF